MSLNNRPIGVFDSGIGGLTVVKELIELLPFEDIIYFGDTGRVPYGTRDRETIIKYASQDIEFLISHNVKMIVTACGTASALFPPALYEKYKLPYTGVVIPAAKAACAAAKSKKIGVIGTQATIKNRAYEYAVKEIDSSVSVVGNACPLLVPLVENGYFTKKSLITKLALDEYLEPFIREKIDVLILGCTHYPLLKDAISDIMGEKVTLIDAGKETAGYVAEFLTGGGLLKKAEKNAVLKFFVSDNPEGFSEGAEIFLGAKIETEIERIELG